MISFAVIMLALILIALTHIHNWVVRRLCEDFTFENGTITSVVIVTVVYIGLTILMLKYIIIWGQVLI